jgi:hypothetical protein
MRDAGLAASVSALTGLPGFAFGFAPLDVGDLVVDAGQPHGVPHPQGEQTLQVRWQVVEHFRL